VTIVVGFSPEKGGRATLELAVLHLKEGRTAEVQELTRQLLPLFQAQKVSRKALATIKLNYSKMVAEAGPCGLWPHDLGPSADPFYASNKNYWNHGCATQRNLASMVENPADLVQPRGEAPPSAGRRQVVYDKYRKGEAYSGAYPDTDKAKISDVGK